MASSALPARRIKLVHVWSVPIRVILPVSGTVSGFCTRMRSAPLGAATATTAVFGPGVTETTGDGGVGLAPGPVGVRVAVRTVAGGDAGVRAVGVGVALADVALRVGVKAREGVGVGVTAAHPKSGVRHTPGVVPGVGKLQSADTAQEKSAKSPPSQKRPVDAQLPPGQCAARKQPKPRKSPPVHIFCVPTQARPAPHVPSPAAVRHVSPAKGPPWQVPSAPVPTHVPPGQSHGKPSNSPPSHTPWITTHTPNELGQETKQSVSDSHAAPSRGPPLQANTLVTCPELAMGQITPIPTNSTTFSIVTTRFPHSCLHHPCVEFSQLRIPLRTAGDYVWRCPRKVK